MKNKTLAFCSVIAFLLWGYMLTGCSDSDDKNGDYPDPSKPIVFKDFTPKEGSARTRLYIEGNNFGTDISRIQVWMGDLQAHVIGSTGTKIYCMVPQRAYEGTIKVIILGENGEPITEHTFGDLFEYVSSSSVATLCGKVDEANNNSSSMIDGSYEEAEFVEPWWLLFEKNEEGERTLYIGEPGKAIRKINLEEEEVSTIVSNGQGGFHNFQTMTFSHTRDTMFFVDDNGQNNQSRAVISYSLRSENFRRVYPYVYDRCGYSCVTHPIDGNLFYNTYFNAAVMKPSEEYDEQKKEWKHKELYTLVEGTDNNQHTYLIMHPEGLYAYILGYNCIFKSMYDTDKQELQYPLVFVGQQFSSGWQDLQGGAARFSFLRQGVFVKNEEYVKEPGRTDFYDFYVCDVDNHCIRKVTPDGQVTTFAGRGSYTVDGSVEGYIDGDLREDARFSKPSGIAYDEENAVFYIGEIGNHRIRYITIE